MKIKGPNRFIANYKIQIIFLRLLLDLCFEKYTINAFGNSNYQYAFYSESNIYLYIVSWLVLLPTIFIAEREFSFETPSRTVLQFVYIIQFIPFTSMLGHTCFSFGFSILTIIYWMMILFLSKFFLKKNSGKKHDFFYHGRAQVFEMVTIFLCGITVLYFGYVSGFRIDLDIFKAYDLRTDAMEIVRAPGSTYLLGLSRILIPTGIVYSIQKKKFFLLALFILFGILGFSFDGSKALYFVCFVAIFVGLFYNQKFNKYIPFLLNVFLCIGYLEFLFSTSPLIYRLIIRRLFFVPNVINNSYYDFMLTHSPNMFSNLLRFIGMPVSYDISFVIGSGYFLSDNMSANTGTIGDALWQFKYLGVVILPILIIMLLKALDFCTRKIPYEMLIIPCVVFAYYLNNSSFTAACFSHGLVFFCIVMQTYRCRIQSKEIDDDKIIKK